MKRGDLVVVALQGDQGKPRPALIVQADYFGELQSVTVLPITSTLAAAPVVRVRVDPDGVNGLARLAEIMVDKPQTPLRNRVGAIIGHLDEASLGRADRALAVFFGLA